MTRDVLTVTPETTLRRVAALLAERGIGGVPVCDEAGRVLGVVSEGDIVRKQQEGAQRGGGMLTSPAATGKAGEAKAVVARTAGDAMSSPAITVPPGAPIAEAARLMLERGVKRLPVVAEGALVGIVTRADVVRAFCRPDEEIRRELSEDLLVSSLWIAPERVRVTVRDGMVELAGEVDTRTQAELIEAYAQRVAGVIDVVSQLTWQVDDLAWRTGATGNPPRR